MQTGNAVDIKFCLPSCKISFFFVWVIMFTEYQHEFLVSREKKLSMNKYEWENVRGVQPFPFALICLSQPRLSHFLALILQFAPRISIAH